MKRLNGHANNDVRRLNTKDRRRGYKTPTENGTQCPYYEGRWAYFADKSKSPDFVSVCTNHDIDCSYRKTIIPEELSGCGRYLKIDNDNFVLDAPPPPTGDRQHIAIQHNVIRLFRQKKAKVTLTMPKIGRQMQHLLDGSAKPLVPFTTNKDGHKPAMTLTTADFHIGDNVGYLAGVLVKGMDKETDMYASAWFDVFGGDDDSVQIIFRYNRTTKSYYSLNWNRGGLSPDGLSITKHICTDPVAMTYSTSVIYHYPGYYWVHGGSVAGYPAANFIRLQVVSDVAYIYTLKRPPNKCPSCGSYHFTGWGSSGIPLLYDNRLTEGTYGFGSTSQGDLYFRELLGYTSVVQGTQSYVRTIDLASIQSRPEGGKELSVSMKNIFQSDIDNHLTANGMTDEDTTKTYVITSHNVGQAVTFPNGTNTTTDGAHMLITPEWNYDKRSAITASLIVASHMKDSHEVTTIIPYEYFLESTDITLDSLRLDDAFDLYHNGVLHYTGYAADLTQTDELDVTETVMATSIPVRFVYDVQRDVFAYYTNPLHIDTHNRRYGFKSNELGWHE